MADRSHHSIGEVLSLLKEDFPDITISKIRFLESQGLIEPERTPSGYRKFYDREIDRLRWILTQQRDNFLPLKVIKRRLEDAGFDPVAASDAPLAPAPEPTLFARRDDGAEVAVEQDATREEPSPATPDEEPSPPPAKKPRKAAKSAASSAPSPALPASADPLAGPEASVAMNLDELAGAAGVDPHTISELERLGLIESAEADTGAVYDHEALVVAAAAAAFIDRGLEPRHLRMFKVAADREAGVIEQLVTPLSQRADSESRAKARTELSEMVRLGESIHRSILRRLLARHLR